MLINLAAIDNGLTYEGCPNTFLSKVDSVIDSEGDEITDYPWL